MPVPENLDYDMWLGSTPNVYYTEKRVHPQLDYSRPGWLRDEQFGAGMITGWGAHHLDTATPIAISCFRVCGRSCDLAIRPKPIWPIWILLLGAVLPSTWEGTMVGNAMAPAAKPEVLLRNFLLCIAEN